MLAKIIFGSSLQNISAAIEEIKKIKKSKKNWEKCQRQLIPHKKVVKRFLLGAGICIFIVIGAGISSWCFFSNQEPPSQTVVYRLLQITPQAEKELLDRLEKHTGMRFEIVLPKLGFPKDIIKRNVAAMIEVVYGRHDSPDYKKLHPDVKTIIKFIKEQMDPRILKKNRPQHTMFGFNKSEGKYFDGKFGFYLPKVSQSSSGDAVMFYNFCTHASIDTFSVLIIHEIDHVLRFRQFMKEKQITSAEMEKLIREDKELLLRFEDAAWRMTLEYFGYLLHCGLFNRSDNKRPLIDLLILDSHIQGLSALNKGNEVWNNFLRDKY